MTSLAKVVEGEAPQPTERNMPSLGRLAIQQLHLDHSR